MLNKNNYFLILIFFLYELKNYLNILFKKIDALKHYKLNNLIKFFKDRSVNPSNNIFFKKFTKLNKKKWPTNLQNNKGSVNPNKQEKSYTITSLVTITVGHMSTRPSIYI